MNSTIIFSKIESAGIPTTLPSRVPTTLPSTIPTTNPSNQPSVIPSNIPTFEPSAVPTNVPSILPTRVPTSQPTQLICNKTNFTFNAEIDIVFLFDSSDHVTLDTYLLVNEFARELALTYWTETSNIGIISYDSIVRTFIDFEQSQQETFNLSDIFNLYFNQSIIVSNYNDNTTNVDLILGLTKAIEMFETQGDPIKTNVIILFATGIADVTSSAISSNEITRTIILYFNK